MWVYSAQLKLIECPAQTVDHVLFLAFAALPKIYLQITDIFAKCARQNDTTEDFLNFIHDFYGPLLVHFQVLD